MKIKKYTVAQLRINVYDVCTYSHMVEKMLSTICLCIISGEGQRGKEQMKSKRYKSRPTGHSTQAYVQILCTLLSATFLYFEIISKENIFKKKLCYIPHLGARSQQFN